MVSNAALAAVCVWSGLYEYALHESHPMKNSIREYALKLKANQIKEYQAAENEGRSPGQFWLEIVAPKVSSMHSLALALPHAILDSFGRGGVCYRRNLYRRRFRTDRHRSTL